MPIIMEMLDKLEYIILNDIFQIFIYKRTESIHNINYNSIY